VNDYVEVNNPESLNLDSSTDFTFTAWIKAEMIQKAYPAIFGRRNPDPYNGYILYLHDNGKLSVQLNDGSYTNYYSTSDDLPYNAWHHVATTGDRDGYLIFYVDGAPKGQDDISNKGNIDSTANLFIGWEERNPTDTYFNGTVDDVRIYDRALSAEEIWQLYQQGL